MKKRLFFLWIGCVFASFVSCNNDDTAPGDTALFAVPVYKSLAEIRSDVKVSAARQTASDGKIYVAKDRLFYIAQESGIHIFDNSDPAQPQNAAFIELAGVHDIAVKGDYLYADNFVDLLVFDISDIGDIQLVQTVENAVYFAPAYPEDAEFYDWEAGQPENKILIGYRTERRERPDDSFFPGPWEGDNAGGGMGAPANGSVGTGGSYAKFQINGDALYTTEDYSLKVFNIADPLQAHFDKEVYMQMWFGGGEFETLFKQGDFLFVGATTGMFVVDATDAFDPVFISGFSHATACDPVVVSGTTAYITVRGGSLCGAIEDQVNVIDISDIYNPGLVSSYLLEQPKGLGIRNGVLYVCSADGLQVFDATDGSQLELKNTYAAPMTDVIPMYSHLVAVGPNTVTQYDYGPDFTLVPISTVSF